ncbi:MAG: phosphoribosylamine--glycine ligase [Acidimicrobiales bacterium]
MRVLVIGGGGREAAIAWQLAKTDTVFCLAGHENPSLLEAAHQSGGRFAIVSPTDGEAVAQFAKANDIELAFVSADAPLEAGVVDALLDAAIPTVGPRRAGARIEWDKRFALELMREILPQFTPRFWVIESVDRLEAIFAEIAAAAIDIVVKPQGLTAGKGVKVMGPHLSSLQDAKAYTRELLEARPAECVLIVEKCTGHEFTLMCLTDGVSMVAPPATYDYPYRFAGDTGPGTGGMGAFSGTPVLPFLSMAQYRESVGIAKTVLAALSSRGISFNGVLNLGLFCTPQGLKFMEFNARFGDPEAMNILMVLETPLADVLRYIASRELDALEVRYSSAASVVKYLVSPEYALTSGVQHHFELDVAAIEKEGLKVFFSSAAHETGASGYRTVGNSRAVAVGATAGTAQEASERIERALSAHVKGPLEWRRDIGSAQYIGELTRR